MKKLSIAIMLTLMGFVASGQTARAEVTSAPSTSDSARLAVSPYAQAVPNDSYTFMGISHPSLDTAHTSIGVVVEVLDMSTVPNNASGRSAVFTVDAGETHRVFVVNVTHSVINTTNSDFTDARTHLIFTEDTAQFGNVKVTGVFENPNTKVSRSGYAGGSQTRFDNVGQLNMWGVVFIPSSGTGFAMEFIGDAHDSTIGGNVTEPQGLRPDVNTGLTGAGRGVN